jgi:hypothetical protein
MVLPADIAGLPDYHGPKGFIPRCAIFSFQGVA